jgi:hypothetical protein
MRARGLIISNRTSAHALVQHEQTAASARASSSVNLSIFIGRVSRPATGPQAQDKGAMATTTILRFSVFPGHAGIPL